MVFLFGQNLVLLNLKEVVYKLNIYDNEAEFIDILLLMEHYLNGNPEVIGLAKRIGDGEFCQKCFHKHLADNSCSYAGCGCKEQ